MCIHYICVGMCLGVCSNKNKNVIQNFGKFLVIEMILFFFIFTSSWISFHLIFRGSKAYVKQNSKSRNEKIINIISKNVSFEFTRRNIAKNYISTNGWLMLNQNWKIHQVCRELFSRYFFHTLQSLKQIFHIIDCHYCMLYLIHYIHTYDIIIYDLSKIVVILWFDFHECVSIK